MMLPDKDSVALAWFCRIFMIWPVKLMLPLSVVRVVLAHSLYPSLMSPAADIHCVAEVLLFLHYLLKRFILTHFPACATKYKYPGIDRQKNGSPLQHLEKCLTDISHSLDPTLSKAQNKLERQAQMAQWFVDRDLGRRNRAPAFEQIHRDHCAEWLAWAFFDHEPTPAIRQDTEACIDLIETWAGKKLQSGPNKENVKALTLTLDPLRCQHHPILHYVVTHLFANVAGWAIFTMRGFKRKVRNGQVYYHRPCKAGLGDEECRKPLIYISGIGIGLVSYEALIKVLSTDDRDILLFDLPEISLRWTPFLQHAHASPLQTVETISQLIGGCRRGEEGAHAVAHSFGCVVVQWLIRLNTKSTPLVSSLTFVDPVCFLLISPSVAAHFCYRFPKTFLDLLVSYFVAREIGVNNALHRHFQWKLNNVDPKLLPEGSAIILSELDAFVPSVLVERHLNHTRPDLQVKMLKGHFHSQFSVVPSSFNLVADMSRAVDKTDS
jgi:pimeloyl-ACP methyl ester carboxylesterase